MDPIVPPATWAPSRATLRQLLLNVFRLSSELDAFLMDYFGHVYQNISQSMDTASKLNILLCAVETNEIWRHLRRSRRNDFKDCQALFDADSEGAEAIEGLTKVRKRLNQHYIEREVFVRYQLDAYVRRVDESIRTIRRELWRGPTAQENAIIDDKYILVRELGKGGFGAVWLAVNRTERERPRAFAVKLLYGRHNDDKMALERFARSVKNMKKLRKMTKSIVEIIQEPAFDTTLHLYYYVMAHQPNGSLSQALEQGRIERKAALKAILDICQAMEIAHAQSIIHRDIKPANILLDESWRGVLGDFDLVRDLNDSLPSSGGQLGTIGYAAPENLERGTILDARSDVYSLAQTIIYVLTNKHPSVTTYGEQNVKRICQLDVGDDLKSVLIHATKEKVEDRLASVNVLTKALDEVVHDKVMIAEFGETMYEENYFQGKIRDANNFDSPAFDEQIVPPLESAKFAIRMLTGNQRGEQIVLPCKRPFVIGRSQSCDLVIDHLLVSRKHAKIIENDDVVTILDLDSANGVFVNSEKIEHEKVINYGDKVAIGNVIFQLVRPGPPNHSGSITVSVL